MTERVPSTEGGDISPAGRLRYAAQHAAAPLNSESTIVGGPARAAPQLTSRGPILAVVAIYAPEASDPTSLSRAANGLLYPLRAGDALFVGRPPGPRELGLADGTRIPITHRHLFPPEHFLYVSKRHLLMRARQDGTVELIDLSRYGTFLIRAERHLLRGDKECASVVLAGDERLLLGLDPSTAKEAAVVAQLELILLPRSG